MGLKTVSLSPQKLRALRARLVLNWRARLILTPAHTAFFTLYGSITTQAQGKSLLWTGRQNASLFINQENEDQQLDDRMIVLAPYKLNLPNFCFHIRRERTILNFILQIAPDGVLIEYGQSVKQNHCNHCRLVYFLCFLPRGKDTYFLMFY